MTNYLVMLECSAMPKQMKRTTLTQEAVRVLRNCRQELPWEMKAVHLTDLSARMKASGYSEMFRQHVIMSALQGFDKMVEVAEQGGRPVNRPRSWEADLRQKKKTSKKMTWHKAGGFDVPVFLPFTPGSQLVQQLKEAEERSMDGRKIRFRFVERAGTSLKEILQKSDPWAGGQCGSDDCFPCKGSKGGDCRRNNVTYQIVCEECESGNVVAHYKGETSKNTYTRGLKHLEQLRNKSKDSVLWAHCKEHHQSSVVSFKMEKTGSFSDPLSRQIMEGVQINVFGGITLNRQSAWRQPAVSKVKFTRALD